MAERDFRGLCFVNLVDFDMLYGHRQDAEGYTRAMNEFDAWLGTFLPLLGEGDALLITADHGCDPSDLSTDHTREDVPYLEYVAGREGKSLGTVEGFAHVGERVCALLDA